MSKNVEEQMRKVDELLAVLNYIAKDLKEVSAELKASLVSPAQASAEAAQMTVESVKASFPKELRELLEFEDKGDFIIIKPKGFLGSDNFAKIAEIVKELGGDYVSLKKDSHFRVYKKLPTAGKSKAV